MIDNREILIFFFIFLPFKNSIFIALTHLTGYNGLPSLISSGLDDSLSDIAAKRKYPFELEKAIHNVMFIQHHMQRQDEFNAVSYAIISPLALLIYYMQPPLCLKWDESFLRNLKSNVVLIFSKVERVVTIVMKLCAITIANQIPRVHVYAANHSFSPPEHGNFIVQYM